MTYATLRMNGREYVLVPKSDFRRMTAEDKRDSAEANRAMARLRAGKLKTVSHATLRRRLGLTA
jgi:hypothetical protein